MAPRHLFTTLLGRRRLLAEGAFLVLVASAISCGERATGPASGGPAYLAFQPTFTGRAALVQSSLTAFGLTIDNVRIRLERADGSVVVDTVVAFALDQDSVAVTLRIDLTGNQETFEALIELREGTTVLFAGTQSITARAGVASATVPEIPTEWVGPGASATAVTITPRDTIIAPDATVDFAATATDAAEQPVPDVPMNWALSDSSKGTVDATGLFTATAIRGTTWVIVRLPTLDADSVLVTIVPPATHLALISGGGQTGPVGAALGAPIVVEARAADNLPVPGVTVTFALTLGGGTLSEDTLVTDNLGRASVSLTLDQVPGARTVQVASTGLPSVDVGATGVAAAASQLVIIQGPPAAAAAGVTLSTTPIVEVRDSFGNPVLIAGTNITVALTSQPMGTLGGTVTVATNASGQATFAGLSVNGPVGNASLTFTSGALTPAVSTLIAVSLGPPTNLVVEGGAEINVIAGDTVAPIHALRVVDAGGNGIEGESILVQQASNPDTTLITAADGRAQLSALGRPIVAGVYELTFSSGTLAGSPTVITITVLPSSASQLVVAQSPSSTAVSGAPLAQQPFIQVLDSLGNTSFTAGIPVTAEVLGGSHTLGGTVTVNTGVTGLASFTNLSITGPNGPVQLRFTSPGLANVLADPITLSLAPATHLVFDSPPVNGSAGAPFTVVVSVRTAQNAVATDYNAEIVIALGANPGGATLGGTVALDAVNGIATFTGITVNNVANGYTMTAAGEGLTGATSAAFNMVAGAGTPTQLAFTTQPVNVPEGEAFSVAVTARDAFNDPATGFTGPVTLAIGTNPASGVLGGVTTVNAISGVATFTGLSISADGAGYTLVATSSGLTQATSNAFEVTFSGVTYHDERRAGDIAIYKNYNAWSLAQNENRDEVVLRATPFKFAPGLGDYFVRSMSELASGIPAQTSLLIITSASEGNYNNQITDQNAGAANLDAWVRNGGWLVVHAGDNAGGQAYIIPGMLAAVDDSTSCTGTELAAVDHALIRGPDAVLGTADDLVDGALSLSGYCSDNHGALNGKLPGNAEVLMREAGIDQRSTYATYTLGAGRVIVTTLSIEYLNHPTQTMVNHLYWAINGVNAQPAQPIFRAAHWLGGDGVWSDSTKWDIGIMPAIDDTVRIEAPGTYAVTLDGSVTAEALVLGGGAGVQSLHTSFWSLSLNGPSVVASTGALHVEGGTLGGANTLLVNGSLLWTGGTMSGTGTTRIGATGTGAFDVGALTLNGGRRFEIAGTFAFRGGSLQIGGGSQLLIEDGAELDIRNSTAIGLGSGGGSILNQGRVARTTAGSLFVTDVPFTNAGEVEILFGDVEFGSSATVTHSGQFIVQPGRMLSFNLGTHTFNGPFSGGGVVRKVASTMTLNAPSTFGGLVASGAGALNIAAAVTISDSLRVSAATLNLNSGALVNVPLLVHISGTIAGADTLVVLDSLHWASGAQQGTGFTRVVSAATSVFTTTGAKSLGDGRGFSLQGNGIWNSGTLTTSSSSPFIIAPTGVLDMVGDLTFTASGSGSLLVEGRFVKSAGVGNGALFVPTTVTGEMEAASGTLAFESVAAVTHTGQLIATAPAVLDFAEGTHTVNATITGSGRVRFTGANATLNGSVAVAHFMVSSNTITATASLVASDSLVVQGGSLNLNTGTNVSVARLLQLGGTLQGSDTLIVTDSLHWIGGTMGGTGTTRVALGADATLTTATTKTLIGGRRFEILGTARWNDGTFTLGGGSPVIVGATGLLEIHNNINVGTTFGGGSLTNLGTISRPTGAAIVAVGVPVTNAGLIDIQTGTVRFTATGTLPTLNGTVNVAAGAIADFGAGTVTVASTFTGAGTATFSGAAATLTGSYGLPRLTLSASSLTLASGGQVDVPQVVISNGTLQGTDTLVVTDTLDWSGGTMSGTGVTQTLDTTFTTLSTTNNKNLLAGRKLQLDGTAFLMGGTISLGGASTITIGSTGILMLLGDFGISTTTGGGNVLNQGSLMKSTGTGVSTIGAPFVNDGTVAVFTGTLRFSAAGGPFTHAGDFAVTDPAVLDFSNGTHLFNGTVAGTGTVLYSGATTTVTAILSVPRLTITGGTVTLNAGGTHSVPLVVMSGGTLAGPDTLIVTDSMHWSAGTMNGGGATRILDGVTLSMTTTSAKTLTGLRGLELAGTAILNSGDLTIGGGSAFTIEPTATFAFEGIASIIVTTGSGTVVNNGAITRYVGANLSNISVPFTNAGTVDVTIGTLRLSAAGGPFTHSGDFAFANPAIFDVQGSATHNFTGDVTGTGAAIQGGSATSNYAGTFGLASISAGSGTANFSTSSARVEIPQVAITGGTIGGTDTLVVTDSMTWTTGNLSGTGVTQIVDTAKLALTTAGGRQLLGGRKLSVAGAMVANSGSVTFGGGSTLLIESGGTLDIQLGVSFPITTLSGVFTNDGAIIKSGTGTATLTVPFSNNGSVDVQNGFLVLQPGGTVTHSGNFTATAPGAITFTTGTHTVNGTVSGTGLVAVTAGTSTFSNAVTLPAFNSTGGLTFFTSPAFAVDTLRGTAGTYTFNSGSQHDVPVVVMGGYTLDGIDTITVLDSLNWISGTMTGTGRTEIAVGASAVLSTTGAKTLSGGRSFDVAGTLLWSGGNWTLAGGSPITVSTTGQFTMAAAVSLSGTGSFVNEGVFRRSTVAGTGTVQTNFTNLGDVEVTAGTLFLSQTGSPSTHTGPFLVTAPGILSFGGAVAQVVDSSITGTGTGTLGSASLTVNGSYLLPVMTAGSGVATFNGPVGTLDTLRQTGGTVTLNGGAAIPVTRLVLTAGTLQGSDSIIVVDSMDWSGGTMAGTGVTQIVNGAELVMAGGARSINGGRALRLDGHALWSVGTTTVGGGSPITVGPTGDLQITGNVTMNTSAGLGAFLNQGLVRRTAGTGFATFTVPFENAGTVQSFTGSLSIAPPGTVAHSGNWEVTLPSLITFSAGTQTVDGTITGTGRVSFAATAVTVNGNMDVGFIQQATGTTTILGTVAPLDSLAVQGGTIISFNSGAQIETGVLLHVAGVIAGVDTIVVLDSLDWQGGTMGGSGLTVLPDTAVFNLRGGVKTLSDTRELRLDGLGNWTAGAFTLNAGTVLRVVPTGELDIRWNASSSGSGSMINEGRITKTISTGTATLGSQIANNGEFELQLGSVTFSVASGTMTHAGPFVVGAGTLLSFTGAAVHQVDSTITGAGTVTLGGSSMVFNDSVSVPKLRYTGGTLAVNAPLVVTDSLIASVPTVPLTLNVPMTIPGGAVMSMQNSGGISGTGSLTNLGTFQKLTNNNPIAIAVPFNNQGSVSSGVNTLNFTRSFAHTAAGALRGGATIQLNPDSVTVFDGAIAPGTTGAGQLSLTGAFVQSTASPINIEIGGTIVGSQYDRLFLNSQAVLNGVLNLTVINGFVPAPSANFVIVQYPAGTPTPSLTLNLPANWTISYVVNANAVTAIAPP